MYAGSPPHAPTSSRTQPINRAWCGLEGKVEGTALSGRPVPQGRWRGISVRAILGPGCVCRARRKRRRSGWNGRHALASAQRWTDRSSVPPCLPGVPPRPVGRRACLGVSPWKPSHPPLPNSGCGDIGHPTIPAEHRPPAEFLRGNLAIGGNAQVTSEAMGIRRPLCLSHKVAWEGLRSLPPLLRRGIGRYNLSALIRGRFGRASLSSAPKGSLGGPWLQPA